MSLPFYSRNVAQAVADQLTAQGESVKVICKSGRFYIFNL
jgi:predicted aminopeptidase